MLTLRKSSERGTVKFDWLDSRHSFSFGDYYDPHHMGFGPLRVINEDIIAAGGGFPLHPHRDMEIVTYVLDGALEHQDSLGNKGVIRPGEIQRMSAGTGIVHAEFNASRERECRLLQIWILPSKAGLEPSYEQKNIDPAALKNSLLRIASPNPRASEVRIVQDAEIWAAKLDADVEVAHPLQAGRRLWLHVACGTVEIGNRNLETGDAAAISDEDAIAIRSREPSELLLFDLA
jgi:redox-sensitive bicupin YhaK (pirin superfamily)